MEEMQAARLSERFSGRNGPRCIICTLGAHRAFLVRLLEYLDQFSAPWRGGGSLTYARYEHRSNQRIMRNVCDLTDMEIKAEPTRQVAISFCLFCGGKPENTEIGGSECGLCGAKRNKHSETQEKMIVVFLWVVGGMVGCGVVPTN